MCKSNFDCTNNAECIDGQCFCQTGFIAKGASCFDIDECLNNQTCGLFSVCINNIGSYSCECVDGYVGAPPKIQCKAPCDDVNCGDHAYCKPDGQEAYCICDDGWTFNPSDISVGCIGKYDFQFNFRYAKYFLCLDIDECDKINGPSGRCGENSKCTNLPGTFACQCQPGYTGNPNKQCIDVNECTKSNICGQGAICTNLPGTYSCDCPEGTIPDPDARTKCNEIVTCKSDNDCPGNSVCDNKKRCLCPEPNVGNDCRRK